MSASPQFKLYNREREYVASTKYAEDAAALCAILGEGTTIRYMHHTIVWTEGREAHSAGLSYDSASTIMWNRIRTMHREALAKVRRQS